MTGGGPVFIKSRERGGDSEEEAREGEGLQGNVCGGGGGGGLNIFFRGRNAHKAFYSFKRGAWYTVFRENPSREAATKDHSSSNPPKGKPPDLKTKVGVSKVDVKGFPNFWGFQIGNLGRSPCDGRCKC